jgi:hypothetical protein
LRLLVLRGLITCPRPRRSASIGRPTPTTSTFAASSASSTSPPGQRSQGFRTPDPPFGAIRPTAGCPAAGLAPRGVLAGWRNAERRTTGGEPLGRCGRPSAPARTGHVGSQPAVCVEAKAPASRHREQHLGGGSPCGSPGGRRWPPFSLCTQCGAPLRGPRWRARPTLSAKDESGSHGTPASPPPRPLRCVGRWPRSP